MEPGFNNTPRNFYPTVEQLESARDSLIKKGYTEADFAEDSRLIYAEAKRIVAEDYEN